MSIAAGKMVAVNAVGLWASDRYFLVPMRTFVWLAADRSCRVGGPPLSLLYQLLDAIPSSVPGSE